MRCIEFICLILLTLTIWCGPVPGQASEPTLDFSLSAPASDVHRQYLGLENGEPFVLGQIKADIVIIEIFSMYCPICQREAANVNTLFYLIQALPSQGKSIRLVGIGAGNSAFEVEFFRKKYAIDFPLFSDGDFVIHKKIGEVRTPHFFGLKRNEKGDFDLFYSGPGDAPHPEVFLKSLLKKAQ
ncbi:peroxiredoxin family protein [Desulfocicer niacini]